MTKNPDAMISALRKIENRGELHAANSAVMEMCIDNPREGFADIFATHPPVDERVEAFASLVWDGVYDYTYVARATTPGTFVVPPPKAEEMYAPETFGRGSGDRLVVE